MEFFLNQQPFKVKKVYISYICLPLFCIPNSGIELNSMGWHVVLLESIYDPGTDGSVTLMCPVIRGRCAGARGLG